MRRAIGGIAGAVVAVGFGFGLFSSSEGTSLSAGFSDILGAAPPAGFSVNSDGGSPSVGLPPPNVVKMFLSTDPDRSGTHSHPDYATDHAAADVIIDLYDDEDGMDFAWAMISKWDGPSDNYVNNNADWSAWVNSSNRHRQMELWTNYQDGSGFANGKWNIGNHADDGFVLMRLDLLNDIPAGYRIRHAYLHKLSRSNLYAASTDTLVAVLLDGTNPSDTVWWQESNQGTTSGSDACPDLSFASWNNQTEGDAGLVANGYPSSPSDAWSPALNDRAHWWEWGEVADYSPVPTWEQSGLSGNPMPSLTEFTWNITNCVQAIVNGTTNNGIALMRMDSSSSQNRDTWMSFEPRPGHSEWDNVFWITIEYEETGYVAPFPDQHEAAFVFTTDDGVLDANNDWADLYEARGLSYTILHAEDFLGGTNRADFPDLVGWRDQGMEIGSHSRWHEVGPDPDHYSGVTTWDAAGQTTSYGVMEIAEYTLGVDPATFTGGVSTSGMDSLLADTDPIWLYDGMAAANGGIRFESDLLVAKTFATPLNQFSPYAQEAWKYHGYRAVRIGQIGKEFDTGVTELQFWREQSGSTGHIYADGDTATNIPPEYARDKPFNALLHPFTISSSQLVGDFSDPESDANVTRNIVYQIRRVKATHSRLISTYTHSLMDGVGYQGLGYNVDHMALMLDACADHNVWVENLGNYQDWVKTNATAIDYPYDKTNETWDFGQFHETAGDRVWFYKENGSRMNTGYWLGD